MYFSYVNKAQRRHFRVYMVAPTLSGTRVQPLLCQGLHEWVLAQEGCESSSHHIHALSIIWREQRGARCAPTLRKEILQVPHSTSLATKEPLGFN